MGKETKSNGQKDYLDRFYTKDEIVNQCLSLIDNIQLYDCVIEPSAGTGSFSSKIDGCFAFDISPETDKIIKEDWLSLNKNIFDKYNNILVIGNPPFGQQNTLAIQFFNESAKFCNTIAFILPLSFKKDSVQNRLNLNFHLVKELILNDCPFLLMNKQEIKVPCVFQVWEKRDIPRKKIKLKTTSTLFNFTTPEKADFRIQRVGGNAGIASFDLNRAISSNYFIKNLSNKTNEDFVSYINTLEFPSIAYTTGPKSLSKGELVSIIEDYWEDVVETKRT